MIPSFQLLYLAVSGQDGLQRQQIIGFIIPACTILISPKLTLKSQRSSQKIPKANSSSPKIGPKRNMFLGSLIPVS